MEIKPVEKVMEFVIDGIVLGSGTMFIQNGELDTTNLDDEFYATVRKNTKSLLQEAEEEQKSEIIDHLTPEQEEKLKAEHTKDYHGTDDDMPDAYEDWLMELSSAELLTLL